MLWGTRRRGLTERRAVFLDRDGTLIEDTGYVGDRHEVELIDGAAGAVRRLNDAGLLAVLVTNQSGIARGLFTEADFEAVQGSLAAELGRAGAHLDAVYMCPHHPDYDRACDCRKPGTGLHRRAAAELGIDLARSFYVGDRWRDVAATRELGGSPYVVRTGAGGEDAPADIPRVDDVAAAVERILEELEEGEKG